VGFRKTKGLKELTEILKKRGVHINVQVVPELNLKEMGFIQKLFLRQKQ